MIDPLERVVAESEIRNVVARLGHLADDGDLDEYLTLFTTDATWGVAGFGEVLGGHAELLRGARQRRADGIQGPGTGTRHLNTTLWVSVDGPDEARAGSYFLFVDTRTEPTTVRSTGRYDDRFRRTPEGWKLAARTITTDIN